MAKKISSSDLFEQEDLFKGVRDSASKTLAVFNELQAELKATAQGLKTELAANTQASTAQLKQFSAASEQANKLMQQAVQIEKLKAQADQQKIKAEQEIVKLQKMQAQETARLAKEQEKAAKLAANEASAYSKLSAELNKARKAYKDLAVQNQENSVEGKELLDTVTRLDAQLKKVDATVGQHQRNVGNYEGATKSLKLQLRELTQALQNMDESDPRFQQMAQQAGELRDRISDTQAVVKATAGTAMENFAGATAKAGQIGVAAFQGVEASMQLLGVENENVLEGMRRLQALAGLGDALKTLGGLGDTLTEIRAGFTAAIAKSLQFTTAQNTQNVAVAAGGGAFSKMGTAAKVALNSIKTGLIATGIGALVVALGMVVAYWDDIKEAVGGVSEEQKKLNKQVDKDLEAQQHKRKMLDAQENTLRLQGKSEKEIVQYKIDQINGEIKIAKSKLKNSEITAKAEYDAAVRNRGYAEMFFRLWLEGQALLFRAMVAPIDMVLGTANKVSEALGLGKVVTSNINDEITKLTKSGADFFAGLLFDPKEISANNDKIIKENQLLVAQLEGERDGFIMQLKQGDKNAGKDSIKTAEETAQTQIDIQRRLEDEKMAIREESRKKDLDALALEYKRKLEDAKVELKDDKEKASKIAALEKQYQENIRKGIYEINQKWDKIELDQAEWIAQNKAAINEEERQRYIKEAQEEATFEQKQVQAKLASLDGEQKEEYEKTLAFQNELDALNQLKFDGAFASQEDYEKAVANLKKKYFDKSKEENEKLWQNTQEFAQKTTDFLKKQSDERISLIDKEISAAEKQADMYRTLAANGNINAKESLAEQERIIAEGNRRKEREQKRQQRVELANTILQTYASHAAKKPETALQNTIRDASLLQAFISSLPMFYDGTEDTGAGGGVDGKGGFHAVLHPHERVIPKSLNDQIGNLTNEQLTRLAMEYQNGRLVGQDVAHSSMDLAILASKLDNLTDVIKHKPETNIQLGEITQSAMEIVQSTRKGNTTVYNRFKVRK
jgi:hypothetical protein